MIRQESAFDPQARSRAGARGLMQLMPATAREWAQRLGLPYSTARLHDPDYSIRLGTAYFANVLNLFDGTTELALAGYNGGPTRIRPSLGTRRLTGRPGPLRGEPVAGGEQGLRKAGSAPGRQLPTALSGTDHQLLITHPDEVRAVLYFSALWGIAGSIAQRLERPAHNRQVPGSNPGGPTYRWNLYATMPTESKERS